jgi:2'-5' RNA ligase
MTAGHAAFGYHLWLVPVGEAFQRLQDVIDRLAEAHHGPVFKPHVTLLSPLAGEETSLIETNRKLVAGLEPFDLDLTVPEAGTTFFQCIYMRVAESPSLSRTRQAAAEAFALPADNYMPHLSLYYGDASPGRRATILAAVPAQAKCTFPVELIQLIRADSERPVDWHCVDEAPLGGGARRIPS